MKSPTKTKTPSFFASALIFISGRRRRWLSECPCRCDSSSAIRDSETRTLTVSTTVEFNNWFGRVYFLPVRPFHKGIVPTMLKGIIRDLEG